ncbi:hypothetical protein HK405_009015 [Cladochytrium tenue]|nr:hypothetical protein HK405_009015 [Cladochytrium tenue]
MDVEALVSQIMDVEASAGQIVDVDVPRPRVVQVVLLVRRCRCSRLPLQRVGVGDVSCCDSAPAAETTAAAANSALALACPVRRRNPSPASRGRRQGLQRLCSDCRDNNEVRTPSAPPAATGSFAVPGDASRWCSGDALTDELRRTTHMTEY